MNKISTLILSLLFLSSFSFGQQIFAGLQVGANMHKVNGSYLSSDFKGDFVGGIYGGVRIMKVSVHAEVNYSNSQIAFDKDFYNKFPTYIKDGYNNRNGEKVTMSELSVPILVGVKVARIFWIQAGPQFTQAFSLSNADFLKAPEDVIKNGYISGVVGAWVDLPFRLNAGVRYVFGISNRNNTNVDASWRNSTVQLRVGFNLIKL